jgi:hypothetical protein
VVQSHEGPNEFLLFFGFPDPSVESGFEQLILELVPRTFISSDPEMSLVKHTSEQGTLAEHWHPSLLEVFKESVFALKLQYSASFKRS